MSKTAWPTASDVAALLPSGIASTRADDYVAAIVADLEERTGYKPFLADSVASARVFLPPDARSGRSILDLKSGAVAISAVYVDYYQDKPTSGTLLTQYTDWNAAPQESPNIGRPWTSIVFGRNGPDFNNYYSYATQQQYDYRYYSSSPYVKVVARWGFSDSIPMDVWQAVADLAAAKCIHQAQLLGATLLKQGEKQVNYQLGGAMNAAQEAFGLMVMKYQRIF